MDRETLLQHLGEEEKPYGAVTPPITQTSLFVFDKFDDFVNRVEDGPGEPYVYSRVSNPTNEIAEAKLAMLERTDACRLFNSGMAAISASVMSAVEAGSHVVCVDTAYGPLQQFLRDYLPKFGVTTTFVPGISTEEILDAIRPETTLVYLESPSSILFRMQDFAAISEHCRSKGITTITDNSYAGTIFQQPAQFGVDMVVHSATKYIVGHSDVVAGVAVGSSERIRGLVKHEVPLFGAALAPFPAWLLLRGLRTLPMRMHHAEGTGNAMSTWLETQPFVERVYHVGSPNYEYKSLREKQMTGSSSLLSFEPKNQSEEWSRRFIEALRVFQLGVSWGGFESLCVPLQMQPGDWAEPRRLLRVYCGFENVVDLQNDIAQAAAVASS
ncbi:MAG: PLP-dependent aspartate aminotransferase family protein [Fimbriimonadaceae bacterium]